MKIRKYKEAIYPDSDNCHEKESEWLRQVTLGSWLERSPEKMWQLRDDVHDGKVSATQMSKWKFSR